MKIALFFQISLIFSLYILISAYALNLLWYIVLMDVCKENCLPTDMVLEKEGESLGVLGPYFEKRFPTIIVALC